MSEPIQHGDTGVLGRAQLEQQVGAGGQSKLAGPDSDSVSKSVSVRQSKAPEG